VPTSVARRLLVGIESRSARTLSICSSSVHKSAEWIVNNHQPVRSTHGQRQKSARPLWLIRVLVHTKWMRWRLSRVGRLTVGDDYVFGLPWHHLPIAGDIRRTTMTRAVGTTVVSISKHWCIFSSYPYYASPCPFTLPLSISLPMSKRLYYLWVNGARREHTTYRIIKLNRRHSDGNERYRDAPQPCDQHDIWEQCCTHSLNKCLDQCNSLPSVDTSTYTTPTATHATHRYE